jgi:hypothetical protein
MTERDREIRLAFILFVLGMLTFYMYVADIRVAWCHSNSPMGLVC